MLIGSKLEYELEIIKWSKGVNSIIEDYTSKK